MKLKDILKVGGLVSCAWVTLVLIGTPPVLKEAMKLGFDAGYLDAVEDITTNGALLRQLGVCRSQYNRSASYVPTAHNQ